MARSKKDATKPQRAVSLDGQQLGYLIFGALVISGLVFTSGFLIGKEFAPQELKATAASYACLEVLDDVPTERKSGPDQTDLAHLNFDERLTSRVLPTEQGQPYERLLARDRGDLLLHGTKPVSEPLPDGVPGAPTPEEEAAFVPAGDFTLRVSSFRAAEEARKWSNELANKGHKAYVHPSDTDKGRFYDVCVGDFANRADAMSFQRRFENQELIDGTQVREL